MSNPKPAEAGSDASLVARARRKMANVADPNVDPDVNDSWFKPAVWTLSVIIAVSLLLTVYFILSDKG